MPRNNNDSTGIGGGGGENHSNLEQETNTYITSASSLLNNVFVSCDADPKGSVHRAWGISLIFVLIYFVVAIFELLNLRGSDGTIALLIGTMWTALIHLILAILGTFVLKRFPTNFSIGFFLGVLAVLVNQNLILFATFHGLSSSDNVELGQKSSTNHIFANLALTMCLVLAFFTLLLINFRNTVVVAPIDVPKGSSGNSGGINSSNSKHTSEEEEGISYQSYDYN